MALGQGLVGAAVAAGGAMGTLGGAFALVAAPIQMLLGNLRDYDSSLDAVSSAQSSATTAATGYATAQDATEAAIRQVGQTERTVAQQIVAAKQSVTQARQSAAVNAVANAREEASAEDSLVSSRSAHSTTIDALIAAEQELEDVRKDEPRRLAEMVLAEDQARFARQQALEAYRKAVRQEGAGSDEAKQAALDLRAARFAEREAIDAVTDARRNGTDELIAARDATVSARGDERDAAEEVVDQEKALRQLRAKNARSEEQDKNAVIQALRAVNRVRKDGRQQIEESQRAIDAALQAEKVALAALKVAQKEVGEETVKLTRDQKRLYDEYKRLESPADRVFRPAQDAAARLGVSILGLAENYLPRLGSASEATVNALTRAFSTFRSELSRPVEQAGITAYLNLIPRFTEEAATAAGRLGLALFNVFTRSLKYVMPLTRGIGDLTKEFLAFTRSASGQNRIDQFFADAVDRAKELGGVLGSLGRGLLNVFSALNRTGLTDQAFGGLQTIASGFERATRAGGGFEQFLRDVRPLMPFIGQAASDVAGAFFGIANAAISARQKGHKLTVLQEIFRGISRAVQPLQRLVVGTLREPRPEIAKLIPRLTRFFGVFAGSSGPLVTFVRVLNRALQIFNNLPEGVKTTVVNLAALKLILGTLGVGAVVGPMGRFASNMILARGAAAQLAGKSALLGVVGGIARLGALLGAGIGIAAFAGGLYLVYKRNKQIRDAVNDLADKLKNKLAPEIQKAKDLWKNFGKGVARRIDDLGKAIVEVFDLDERKNKVQKHGREAAAQFGLGVRQQAKGMDDDGGPGWEIGTRIGRGIGKGLKAWLLRKGESDGGLPGIGATKWVSLITPAGMVNAVSIWVGKTFGPGILNGIRQEIGWKEIRKAVLSRLLLAFTPGREMIINRVVEPMVKYIREGINSVNWRDMLKGAGRNMALGLVFGFTNVDLAQKMVSKVKDAKDGISKWLQERSPAKRLVPTGRNMALGIAVGFEDGASQMAGRIQNALSGSISNLRLADPIASNRQLRPGDSGYLDDGFRQNSRQSPNRGQPGYVQAEDGSWVPKSFYGNQQPSRPGLAWDKAGRGITKADLEDVQRRISRESNRELISGFAKAMRENIRGGMSAGQLDAALGGYMNHRNSMRPDVR